MNLHVLSETLSFLDINLFESCSGELDLLNDIKSKNQIQSHWLKNTTFTRVQQGSWTLWQRNNLLHREGDLPAAVNSCGIKEWFKLNQLHRERDLPAVVKRGKHAWWLHGVKHRDSGPAVVTPNSRAWWVNGEFIRKEVI